jgi:excisionase family DNA binding protein
MKTKSTLKDKKSRKKPAGALELSNGVLPLPESVVMTLSEAAAFLRAPEDAVEKMADDGKLPARRVGSEWRFLRAALCSWLSQSGAAATVDEPLSSKQRMLALAGVWKDDESVPDLIESIYRERKRNPVGGK